ncbi:MAG: prepilin peptidase [Acidobacteria bacterium]|nr:prepilin peptidase [Acidobacteriota bacterium]
MSIDTLWLIFYTLFGLIIGSFLNVCIYRIPLKKSIVRPGSVCPQCGTTIKPYDNIPVVSWLVLRGKCRFCKTPISIQYPFVELLTGLAFFASARVWDFNPPTLVNSLFLAVIIVLVFTDYHHQILPNVLTIPGTVAGILLSHFQAFPVYLGVLEVKAVSLMGLEGIPLVWPWLGSVIGALFGGGLLYLVAFIYKRLRRRDGLGLGDVKMMMMVGAFLGYRLALLTIFAGALLGFIVGVSMQLMGKANMQTRLAFGVFLGIAAAAALFWGFPFFDWYLGGQ